MHKADEAIFRLADRILRRNSARLPPLSQLLHMLNESWHLSCHSICIRRPVLITLGRRGGEQVRAWPGGAQLLCGMLRRLHMIPLTSCTAHTTVKVPKQTYCAPRRESVNILLQCSKRCSTVRLSLQR
jgi:hypothetical protein